MPQHTKRTRTDWVEIIAAQTSSGLTQAAWCKENSINPNTFKEMRRRVKKAKPASEKAAPYNPKQAKPDNTWIRLPSPPAEAPLVMTSDSACPAITLLIGSIKITLELKR
jgi:hypothetical protein